MIVLRYRLRFETCLTYRLHESHTCQSEYSAMPDDLKVSKMDLRYNDARSEFSSIEHSIISRMSHTFWHRVVITLVHSSYVDLNDEHM